MSIVKLFQRSKNSGDRFEQLISPHITVLFRFAYRLCQCQDGTEELLQTLFARLFSRVDELEKVDNLQPWLKRALYHTYIDHYRKQQRMLRVISADEIPDNIVSSENTPYQDVELNHQQHIVVAAMNQLNDDQRVVMVLHDSEGYTLQELSDILQTPLGTLKSRLHRARASLKEILEMELFNDK